MESFISKFHLAETALNYHYAIKYVYLKLDIFHYIFHGDI